MAHLHVKTPNGTTYSIDLDASNSGGGSSSNNGYSLLPNGVIIQWGTSSASNATTTQTITYTIGFANACYFVSIIFTGTGVANNMALALGYTYPSTITKTNFSRPYTSSCLWFASHLTTSNKL